LPVKKRYASADEYEKKLHRVMRRLGVKKYEWNWDRWGAYVQFEYKGELYRFEHSVAKAQARGLKLQYGSDAFAQIVLSLEDLARMVERGIYDLSVWAAGLKMLPPAVDLPDCFRYLGFKQMPKTVDEVKERYRELAKIMHPDTGGSEEEFEKLQKAKEEAIAYLGRA
jgi:hypothetical protein